MANAASVTPLSIDRKQAGVERLRQIYHTAACIFREQGYESTSLQDIATAVGLTKAGLYYHVQSKELLLFALMNYAMDRVQSDIVLPSQCIECPEQRMRVLTRRYAQLILDDGQYVTLVINETAGLSRKNHKKIQARRYAYYQFVRDTIRRLDPATRGEDWDPSMAALSFFGMMVWLPHWYRPGGRLSRDRVIDHIIKLVCRMLNI